jgi:hypothetical protein
MKLPTKQFYAAFCYFFYVSSSEINILVVAYICPHVLQQVGVSVSASDMYLGGSWSRSNLISHSFQQVMVLYPRYCSLLHLGNPLCTISLSFRGVSFELVGVVLNKP